MNVSLEYLREFLHVRAYALVAEHLRALTKTRIF